MDANTRTTKPRQPEHRSSASSAAFVALGILLSRIAGLVRDRVFAHYLGNSEAAGAFRAALRIPNFLQNLFGEGVLSAAFIPVYSRLKASGDPELARRVAGVVGSALALLVSILVATGIAFTPFIVDLVAPGFEGDVRALTIQLVQILFPGIGLLVLSAWCLGILNSHRRFFISYSAPILWNLAMIFTLVLFGGRKSQEQLVILLAWGAMIGSALQLGIQLPFVAKAAGPIHFSIDFALKPVRDIFRNVLPVLFSRGVVQLSAYVDGIIASFLGPAAVSSLAYAQTLYLLPISLFGMSVAAAELPEMSETAGQDPEAREKLRQRLISGKARIAFFVVPSLLAFVFIGRSVVAALYETGRFGADDTTFVWYVLIGSAAGLLAATWGRLYSSAFYALGDTKTPLHFAIVRVTLTLILGLLFAFPLRPWVVEFFSTTPGLGLPSLPGVELSIGAAGLAFASGLAGWVEYLLLSSSLRSKIGTTRVPLNLQARIWIAGLLASGIAAAGSLWVNQVASMRLAGVPVAPLITIAIYGFFFLATAWVIRIPEARHLARRILRR